MDFNVSNDFINSLFEFIGALFILNNVRLLYASKTVRGVSILSTVYFFMWGAWNLMYYPSLNQWWSFAGGIAIMLSNTLWIGMMIYYTHKNKEFQWQKNLH